MTESMIERVARAIAKADARPYEDAPNLFCGKARAAVEAMREPTDAMVDAAWDAIGEGYDTMAAVISAAAQAALNEQVAG